MDLHINNTLIELKEKLLKSGLTNSITDLVSISEPILLVSAGEVATVPSSNVGLLLHRDSVIENLMLPERALYFAHNYLLIYCNTSLTCTDPRCGKQGCHPWCKYPSRVYIPPFWFG